MNQAPTLGKIRKDIDSHFHGNDRKDKKEKGGHDASCPYIKGRKCKKSETGGNSLNQ